MSPHEQTVEAYREASERTISAIRERDRLVQIREDIMLRELDRVRGGGRDAMAAWLERGDAETRIKLLPEYRVAHDRVGEAQAVLWRCETEEHIAQSRMRATE